MEEEKFELWPAISPSDKDFRNKIGPVAWESIKSKAFRDDNFRCCGCGYEPYDVDANSVLDIHLVKEDEANPENSEFRTTCKLCHIIEHADTAISKEYVALVNSFYSQGEIVMICRNQKLATHIENGDIRRIKKTLPEFLEELKFGKAKESRVKFIFTDKFFQDLPLF